MAVNYNNGDPKGSLLPKQIRLLTGDFSFGCLRGMSFIPLAMSFWNAVVE
jgi:hypothetical protein